ncbi:protein argonaute-2-like isoform X2 [Planococcus citri]|uniref:protein argonaute-2-like isoform X2 n=1 Tax=Planococcus citri TaxID=170843 RepID=UPI0031FA1D87
MDQQDRRRDNQQRGGGGRQGRGGRGGQGRGGPPPERGPPPGDQYRGNQQYRGPPPQGDYRGNQQYRGPPSQGDHYRGGQQQRGPSPRGGSGRGFPPGGQQYGGPRGPPGGQQFSGPRGRGGPGGDQSWGAPSTAFAQPPPLMSAAPKPAWGRQDVSPVEPAVSPEPAPFQAPAPKDPPQQRGKGKKGSPGGDKPQETPSTSKDVSSPTQGITKKIEQISFDKNLIIPRRLGGQVINRRQQFFEKKFIVEVNYLPINFKDINLKIFHYDVVFKPEQPKRLYRPALRLLLDKYVPNRHPAFDGKKNMYAAGTTLAFPRGSDIRDSVKVYDTERNYEVEFDITVSLIDQELSLSKLAQYLKTGTSVDAPQDVIQGVDIALRNAPTVNVKFVSAGRSFFAIPKTAPPPLTGGFELWHGHYQSAIMAWKPYLNVDVANKAFPIPQDVLDFIYNDLQLDPRSPLDQRSNYKLLRFLKGLKIDYKMKSNDPSGYTKRTYKVDDLGPPPRSAKFKPDKEGSRETTVEEYFRSVKKIPLQYPHLPCIKTTNKNLLPIEFCAITPNQSVMRKLDEKQTSNMVRNAAKGTDIRKGRIMDTIGQAGFNADPCAREFGITVGSNFEKVEAHILKAPVIRYQNSTVPVRNGVWQTRSDKFINSPGLDSWVIINTDRKIGNPQIQNLVRNFRQVGDNIGIPVAEPRNILTINARTEQDFVKEFRQFEKGVQILVVIMTPFGVDDIYSKIKRAAELKVGVLTQCIKAATCDNRKMNAMTAQNILLKINSKISGVNHSLAQNVLPEILKRPVMIVGADVTHPAPGSEGLSIAAVAASHDSYAFKYNMLYRLQPGRQEMIQRLDEMIEQQLRFFLKNTNRKPERILYYRDGVSEGQFLQVLNIELQAIRAACKKLEADYQPAITFLVVQKRHHTRFFPTGPNDWDGDRNKNVRAGTLVDTNITHPTEIDFYLVSHQSIQGTARPTKYHLLWDDNNIPQDELEQLTYYLCHMFARCNRSVSYPAPTYYAHLAAFRAKAWWDDQRYDAANLTREQEVNGRIQDHIVNNAPMFFV